MDNRQWAIDNRQNEKQGTMASKNFKETKVFKLAFEQAMDIFETSRSFPKEETYSLTDQVRRSSRSVCTNLAEAYRKNVILLILFLRLQIAMEKIQKQEYGLISHLRVSILHSKSMKD